MPIESGTRLLRMLFDEAINGVKDAQLYSNKRKRTLCAEEVEEVPRRIAAYNYVG